MMARKLGLDEDQVTKLAAILDDIRTERAQAAVNERRSVGAFADLLEAETFDEAQAKAAAQQRVDSAEQLAQAVAACMRKTHALLDDEQRSQLAYLLRSGVLTI